eukprot:gene51736-24976_t
MGHRREAGTLLGLGAGCALRYGDRDLPDAALLSDEGVGQQATLTVDRGRIELRWGRRADDWDVFAEKARRVRKSHGWNGGAITAEPGGAELATLPGCTNFTVGLACATCNLDDQIYSQKQ